MQNYKKLFEEWGKNSKTLMKDTPEVMKAFGSFHHASVSDGALDKKTKELIALATGVTAHCEWCIAIHVKGCLDAGANRAEIMEAAWVAVLMGGGPALMYMQGVIQALNDFKAK